MSKTCAQELLVVVTMLACVYSTTICAQDVVTPDTVEQRNRAKEEAAERERLLKAPHVDLQGNKINVEGQLTLPEETPCFKTDKFLLEIPAQLPQRTHDLGGSSKLFDHFRFAKDTLQKYTGRCIGRQGIGIILKILTNQLLNKGYTTTRLGIPEQDMSTGTLKLTFIPGIIHQIRFPDPAITGRFNAFPARAGDLLNLRDLEQGLEQMKRVTSQDVNMEITPANQLGESDIVISVKRIKPWKLIASLDDTGAKGTGKLQAGLTLGLDNLFDASDILTIGTGSDGERNREAKGTQSYNASYSIPFGYWTYTLSASDSQYHQRISGVNQTFVSSGNAQNLDNKISYMLYRNQLQKNTLQFRTVRRWSHSYIDDTEVAVQYRNTTFAELALIHKHFIGKSQLDMTFSYRWGTPWFDAMSDPGDLPSNSPKLNYQLETFDATLVTPFKAWDKDLSYTATLRAQNSNSSLYASEWFVIGNRWSVRGFDGDNSLGAESGFFLRNDLAIPIANSSHSVYVGIDYGKVYGANASSLLGDQLAGAVLGMRGEIIKGMGYDIFVGTPLNKPDGFITDATTAGFSLYYQF
jgi:hemolysin activation/secretion protein